MSDKIFADNAQFIEARKNLFESFMELEKVLSRLKTSHETLIPVWQGQSGSTFSTASKTLETELSVNNCDLKSMIQDIDMAEYGFTNFDSEIAAALAKESTEE